MTKINEVIVEKTVSEQWRHQALGRLELTHARRQYIVLVLVLALYFGPSFCNPAFSTSAFFPI